MRALADLLKDDPECDAVLELVDGCGELDRKIYRTALDAEDRLTVDEFATLVDRDRSTTYRAIRRLHEHGYLDRERVSYDSGGYCYRYESVDPDVVAGKLSDRLASCHERLQGLVDEFRDRYTQSK